MAKVAQVYENEMKTDLVKVSGLKA